MVYFHKADSLGAESDDAIAKYLLEIGDESAAKRFLGSAGAAQGMGRFYGADQYAFTGVLIGFVPPASSGQSIRIENAMTISPEHELRNKRVKITLDKFYVQSYPGNGTHRILCEFAGKNQVAGETEEMRFAMNLEARDQSSASVSGKPIFMGVTIGKDGIAFEGRTVNVRSDVDDLILDALGNDTFKNGLSLISSVQPALKPFVTLAASVVSATAKRNQNRQVYAFSLGLDFGASTTSAKLRRGSYVVVQGDDAEWQWSNFFLRSDSLALVTSAGKPAPFNYMVFGVSDFEGQSAENKEVKSGANKKAPV